MGKLSFKVSEEIKGLMRGSSIGIVTIRDVKVDESSEKLVRYASGLINSIRSKYTLETVKNDPIIRALRDFYWRIGIDPTKQRPSSEALIRRILKGQELPLINSVVDAGNLASTETFIPIGLYDLDEISGNLVLRYSKLGETFEPIGGKKMKLIRRQPVISDDVGIIHLYPHRDCLRTRIKESTKRVLALALGVPGIPRNKISLAADKTAEYIVRFSGGHRSEVYMFIID